jgi:GNAT superfamily N-acetyltransferase
MSSRHPGVVLIRDATREDWPAMWSLMRPIVEAGETFVWSPDTTEDQARSMWMHEPPGATVVAVDAFGSVLGTAEVHANFGGGGRHVANAGFMVDARHAGRGVGRALGEYVLERARLDGFEAMQFNAVVETNVHAVALWQSLGFEILATVPKAFQHPTAGRIGLHIMYRAL